MLGCDGQRYVCGRAGRRGQCFAAPDGAASVELRDGPRYAPSATHDRAGRQVCVALRRGHVTARLADDEM